MRKRSEIGKTKEAETSAHAPKKEEAKVGVVTCAKCGLQQPGGTSDCLACGEQFEKMTLVTSKTEPRKQSEDAFEDNIGKLAFDLKQRDLDITLAQLAGIVPDERRELRKWVEAGSSDVTPRVRMILEHLQKTTPKPLAGPGARDDVFSEQAGTGSTAGMTVGVDRANTPDRTVRRNIIVESDADDGEPVTYVLGKEMYRVTEFCTFDVGPFSATTKIRSTETREDALHRLREELERVAEVDRITRRDSYIRTYLGIKPELQKAADAKKGG